MLRDLRLVAIVPMLVAIMAIAAITIAMVFAMERRTAIEAFMPEVMPIITVKIVVLVRVVEISVTSDRPPLSGPFAMLVQ